MVPTASTVRLSALPALLVRWALVVLVLGAVLFGLAGRLDLPMLWASLGVLAALGLAAIVGIPREQLRERWRRGPDDRGRVTSALMRLSVLGNLVLSALDVGRLHWSDTVPLALQLVGLPGIAAGLGFAMWAVIVNPFHTDQIRIQTERGHYVVDRGPFAIVRHPVYAGLFLALPSVALAVGSWWALAPAAVSWLLLLRRTLVEERMLHDGLAGYREYAGRVRWRLVPGVW